MFKFTFSSGNAVINPFTARDQDRFQPSFAPQPPTRKLSVPPNRLLPPPTDVVLPSKKRGWTPSSSTASAPTSQPTSTTGWIDTPSRYLEAASRSHCRYNGSEDDGMDVDEPPTKRRKSLTGSIISTAFSAALIGTAVGMTAYRMWRDRGKSMGESRLEPIDQPPPPYQREEWVDDVPQSKPTIRAPRLPRKPRPATRRTPRHRMAAIAPSPSRSSPHFRSPSMSETLQAENASDEQCNLEHQIDWMGDKIRSLIEEGQKALGKEVVVIDDDRDDEEGAEDDGMEGWEEEGSQAAHPSSPTSSGRRRSRRKTPILPSLRTSTSPQIRSAASFPASYCNTPTSPHPGRPRITASSSHSQAIPTTGSPYLGMPSTARLGGRASHEIEDIKVLYESEVVFPCSDHQSELIFEDEDTRGLAERMERIRKTYQIK